jgi:hypothetical protein
MTAGFIDTYLTNVIYPARYLGLVRLAVATVVTVAWIGASVRWRGRRRAAAVSSVTGPPAHSGPAAPGGGG